MTTRQVMRILTKICTLATLPVFFVSCKSICPGAHGTLLEGNNIGIPTCQIEASNFRMGSTSKLAVSDSSLVVENSIGMPMRYIEAGTFMMGSTSKLAASDEYPILKTTIDQPFYIGVYEVTREDWVAVMGRTDADAAHEKPDVYADAPAALSKSLRHPIDNVTWLEAKEFCRRLSEKEDKAYRLPTEAEWEYACRAGSTTEFYWGDTFNLRYAWADENSESHSHPVGQKLPNAWGLYDMAGNQMEWCESIYKYKRAGTPQSPIRGEDEFKLIKGGGWTFLGKYCRSSRRLRDHQSVRESKYGFRVICLTDKPNDKEKLAIH